MDRTWMSVNFRYCEEYKLGVNQFMQFAVSNMGSNAMLACPCRKCLNVNRLYPSVVREHLFDNGIQQSYTHWVYHGERYDSRSYMTSDNNDNENGNGDNEDIRDNGQQEGDRIDELINNVCRGNFIETEPQEGTEPMDESESNTYNLNEDEAGKFYKLLREAQCELYPGCTSFTTLSFIIHMLHLKVLHKWSQKSVTMMLGLLSAAFPNCKKLPKSYYQAKNMLRGLGLSYTRIHACKNDCVLFWKDNADKDKCPKCGESRWQADNGKGKKVPHKILRHFPIKPRLQRFYMSKETAANMNWHKDKRLDDGKVLRHPADGITWKEFDKEHELFAQEARNIRLGLATDGFNPFGNMSTSYSMWPVIVIPYNLPPWMLMKEQYMMMSLLIPGPKAPGKDFDVYMQPLIDELKELWEYGLPTYDASTKEYFQMHAAVIWTISDFPAYSYFSSWSTKGYLACPTCNEDTSSQKLRSKIGYTGHRRLLDENHPWRRSKEFNGKLEKRKRPREYSGDDVLEQLVHVPDHRPGKHPSNKKRKRTADELNWIKRSIFFDLPYWPTLKLRHNLDVMHIEKNVCDNVLGTLLGIEGKTKDTVKAREDLKDMNIRKELHLHANSNATYTMPPARYTLTKKEKKGYCEFLKAVKFPDGYASNISRCANVGDGKVSGMKSHDCHVMLQRLIPVGMRGYLPKDVHGPLVELGEFFKSLCSKTLEVEEVERLEKDIVFILCKLERIFPPAFFDVMVHLVVHLPREALLGGPVSCRWMYPIERHLGSLKQYVSNKARPEGSIAEAVSITECLTFCSMYLNDVETRFNQEERNYDGGEVDQQDETFPFTQMVRPFGASKLEFIPSEELEKMQWYILNNCEEVDDFKAEHKAELENQCSLNVTRRHQEEFPNWFKNRIMKSYNEKLPKATDVRYALACGPDVRWKRYPACIVNNVRFHTKVRDSHRKTQNSGLVVEGEHEGAAIDYYGVLTDVIELKYIRDKRVVLFKCEWFNTNPKTGIHITEGFTSIKITGHWYQSQPYVLASQANQVYYVNDTKLGANWQVVQRFKHRHLWDIPETEPIDMVIESEEVYEENGSPTVRRSVQIDQNEVGELHRHDAEPIIVKRVTEPVEGPQEIRDDEEDDTLIEYSGDEEDILCSEDDDSDAEDI